MMFKWSFYPSVVYEPAGVMFINRAGGVFVLFFGVFFLNGGGFGSWFVSVIGFLTEREGWGVAFAYFLKSATSDNWSVN